MADRSAARAYHHGDLRKALLVAAEAELAERGVEGFTLRGCAKRAGVSHAAPAHHFRDAGALLTALASEGFERFANAMRTRQANETTARGRLIASGMGYIDFALANPALFRLMFSSARPDFSDAALKKTSSEAFEVLVEAMRDMRQVDPGKDKKVMIDVAACWAVAHGLAELLLTGRRMSSLTAEAGDDPDVVYAEIIGRTIPES
jgi:AcrR family transcriptional regulator